MTVPNVLEVHDLTLKFKSRFLFENLSFALKQGDKIAVTGKSGSGKTTLLKCILGFSRPDSGRIKFHGEELTEHTVWPFRQKLGFVPQEPDLGELTVLDFLKAPFSYRANRLLSWDEDHLVELMQSFHLEGELLSKKASSLSGGEKQRMALLSALLLKRDIYLLDEVTSALDEETRNAVIDYLKMQRETAFIFVSHDRAVKAFCRETITLKPSQLQRAGE